MSRVLLVLISLCFSVTVFAQNITSPDALADAIKRAITDGNSQALARLISPETRADKKRLVIKDFMAYRRAEHFSVKLVAPNGEGWEGLPLPELIKQQKKAGYVFPARPLGRILVSGKRKGARKISKFGAFYGKSGKQYLLIFSELSKK